MWFKFVLAGQKEVVQKFGNHIWELVKNIPSKFQLIAAYFASNQDERYNLYIKGNLESAFRNLEKIQSKKNIPVVFTKNGIIFNGQTFLKNNFLEFVEQIDFLHSVLFPANLNTLIKSEQSINVPDGTITVKPINDQLEASVYGRGTTWCISDSSTGMFSTYRLQMASTFYIVFDTTRPEGDPLRRVAVDVNKYGIKLTDLNNHTGDISEFGTNVDEYLKYLSRHGVDTSQFVNKPLTKLEIHETNVLSRRRKFFQSFIDLSKEGIDNVYSKYISFGHVLTEEQLNFLIDTKADQLINQYLNTGNPIYDSVKKRLNNQQLKTYNRSRNIYFDHVLDSNDGNEYRAIAYFAGQAQEYPGSDVDLIYKILNKNRLDKNKLLRSIPGFICGIDNPKLIDEFIDAYNDYPEVLITDALQCQNIDLIKKIVKKDPENFELLKTSINLIDFSDDFIIQLYDYIKDPDSFVKFIGSNSYFDYNTQPVIDRLIADHKVDDLLHNYLNQSYVQDTKVIDFLLSKGADLKKAYEFVETHPKVPSLNALHIFRKMRTKYPELNLDN